MTKDQFIRTLAEAQGISIKQAKEEVNRVFDHLVVVVPTLAHQEKLDITGIVQFEVSDVDPRKGRNPQTGAEIDLDATRKVVARPMAVLKRAVKGE